MTGNLLLWRWAQDYDTPAKRKKKKLKFRDITAQFVDTGDHPAIGVGDIAAFSKALDQEFGEDADIRPFVFYDNGRCAVINYTNDVRYELIPRVAGIGLRFGLNASEF